MTQPLLRCKPCTPKAQSASPAGQGLPVCFFNEGRKMTPEQAREVLASHEPYVLGKRYGASKQVVGALLRGETYYDARM